MPRTIDTTLKFLPLDTDYSSDHAVKVLCARNGNSAKLVLIEVWLMMCRENGCYLEMAPGVDEILAIECGIPHATFLKIVEDAKELGLFIEANKDWKTFLTSRRAVENFENITAKAKRRAKIPDFIKDAIKSVRGRNIFSEDVSSKKTGVSSEEMGINSELMPINSEVIQQLNITKHNRTKHNVVASKPSADRLMGLQPQSAPDGAEFYSEEG